VCCLSGAHAGVSGALQATGWVLRRGLSWSSGQLGRDVVYDAPQMKFMLDAGSDHQDTDSVSSALFCALMHPGWPSAYAGWLDPMVSCTLCCDAGDVDLAAMEQVSMACLSGLSKDFCYLSGCQGAFQAGTRWVVVATVAFGMAYRQAGPGGGRHTSLPHSLEEYVKQVSQPCSSGAASAAHSTEAEANHVMHPVDAAAVRSFEMSKT